MAAVSVVFLCLYLFACRGAPERWAEFCGHRTEIITTHLQQVDNQRHFKARILTLPAARWFRLPHAVHGSVDSVCQDLTLVFICFLVLTVTASSFVFSDLLCKGLSVTPLQCAGTSAVHHLPCAPPSDYTIRLLRESHYVQWLINVTEISLACSLVILLEPC